MSPVPDRAHSRSLPTALLTTDPVGPLFFGCPVSRGASELIGRSAALSVIAVDNLVKTYSYYRKEPGLLGSFRGLWHRQTLERRAVDGI